jgi:hypothetical protein
VGCRFPAARTGRVATEPDHATAQEPVGGRAVYRHWCMVLSVLRFGVLVRKSADTKVLLVGLTWVNAHCRAICLKGHHRGRIGRSDQQGWLDRPAKPGASSK